MTADEAKLLEGLAAEIRGRPDPIMIALDPSTLLSFVACAQLGLRHPGANGESAARTRRVVADIVAMLRGMGFVALPVIIEMGNNPVYDTPRGT